MPFKYRILFVDDDERLRELAKAILESQGYEVLCAKDGFDGLAALKDSLPDLIISDLQMPNMDGFEFLSVIRQRFPQLPVIVISGEFTGFDVPHSVLADAFFEKIAVHAGPSHGTDRRLGAEIPASPARGKAEGSGVDSACRKRAGLGDLHQLPADLFDSDAALLRCSQCRLRVLLVYDSVPIAVERGRVRLRWLPAGLPRWRRRGGA